MFFNQAKLKSVITKKSAFYHNLETGVIVGNIYGLYWMPELPGDLRGHLTKLGFGLNNGPQLCRDGNVASTRDMSDMLQVKSDHQSYKLTKLCMVQPTITFSGKEAMYRHVLLGEDGSILMMNRALLAPCLTINGAHEELRYSIVLKGSRKGIIAVVDDQPVALLLPIAPTTDISTKDVILNEITIEQEVEQ